MVEADLIVRARQHDGLAWEALMRAHQEAVFRLAYLLLGDPYEAEDAAQEAFIRAYHALDRFDAARPLRPWLLQITANLAHNRRRSAARYWAALQRLARAEPERLASAPDDTSSGLPADDAQALWQAVRRLRPADQEVIYLRYFMELSEAETANTLDVPQGTVKSRTHRALNRLRAVVEREFPSLRESFDA